MQLEIEVDMHLRPMHTSIMDIFKVFESLVCCLKPYGCTLMPLHRPSWPQIWEFWVTCEKGLMSLRHVWGLYPLQTTSNIHIRHTKSFSHCYAVSRILGCTLLPSQQPSWPHIWTVGITCGVRMMPYPHG